MILGETLCCRRLLSFILLDSMLLDWSMRSRHRPMLLIDYFLDSKSHERRPASTTAYRSMQRTILDLALERSFSQPQVPYRNDLDGTADEEGQTAARQRSPMARRLRNVRTAVATAHVGGVTLVHRVGRSFPGIILRAFVASRC